MFHPLAHFSAVASTDFVDVAAIHHNNTPFIPNAERAGKSPWQCFGIDVSGLFDGFVGVWRDTNARQSWSSTWAMKHGLLLAFLGCCCHRRYSFIFFRFLVTILTFFSLNICFVKSIHAEPPYGYNHRWTETNVVYNTPFVPTQSGYHTFETNILSQYGDTILYILHETSTSDWVQLKSNDDCYHDPQNFCPCTGNQCYLRSKFSVNLQQGTTYYLIVRSWGNTIVPYNGGSMELKVTDPMGTTTTLTPAGGADFSGTVIQTNDASNPNFDPWNVYVYQTATPRAAYLVQNPQGSVTGAAIGTVMYGLECGTENIVAIDGLAASSGIAGNLQFIKQNICLVVLGPRDPSLNGRIHFYINDRFIPDGTSSSGIRDEDGDGIGLKLEEAIGTCDRRNQGGICSQQITRDGGQVVHRVFNLMDTDGDGIEDGHEAFGVEISLPNPPYYQYLNLPAYGANPLVKDVFIEVDYSDNSSQNPMTEQNVIAIKNFFTNVDPSILSSHLDIIDTSEPAIRLHFDIGKEPTPGSQDYIELRRLYGNFGGSNSFQTPTTEAEKDQAKNGPYKSGILQNAMEEIRKNFFRHVALIKSRSDDGCNGASYVPSNSFFVEYGNSLLCHVIIAHELGHSIGILHGGSLRWGGDINVRPNYFSIMNYAYDGSYAAKATSFFSDNPPTISTLQSGSPPQYYSINPSNLNETAPVADSFILGYLTINPFNFLLSYVGTSTLVDWNRNFSIDITPTRYPINLSERRAHFGTVNAQNLLVNPLGEPSTPKLIKFAPPNSVPRLYAFYIHNNRMWYQYGEFSVVPNQNSSCPQGDRIFRKDSYDQLINGDQCMSWSTPYEIYDTFPGDLTGIKSVTAIEVQQLGTTSVSNSIMIAYINGSQELKTRWSYEINITNQIDINGKQPGQITWSGIHHLVDTYVTDSLKSSPEFSFTQFNTSDIPQELSVFYIKNNKYMVKKLQEQPLWSWVSGNILKDSSNNDIEGSISPTLLWWPSSFHPSRMLLGIFTQLDTSSSGERIRLFAYDSSQNWWQDITTKAFEGGVAQAPRTFVKPGFVYRFFRQPDGNPINNTNADGQLWLILGEQNLQPILYVSQQLDISQTPNNFSPIVPNGAANFFDRKYAFAGGDDFFYSGSGISLLDDLQLSTIKGIVFWSGSFSRLTFLPFVDNTFNADLTLGSDYKIMEHNICRGIQPDYFCGTIAQSRWGF